MKAFMVLVFFLFSAMSFAGGGVGDGPIPDKQLVNSDENKTNPYLLKKEEQDCEKCEGEESYHHFQALIKKDDEKYLEAILSKVKIQ